MCFEIILYFRVSFWDTYEKQYTLRMFDLSFVYMRFGSSAVGSNKKEAVTCDSPFLFGSLARRAMPVSRA